MTAGQSNGAGATAQTLPAVTVHVDHANSDGSFTQVVTARVGSYTITATGDKSGRSYGAIVDLSNPTVNLFVNRPTMCQAVGLPVAAN